ncbi:MAG: DUF167 domain-containing protein [Candidatus Limnocylindrales bacterium]
MTFSVRVTPKAGRDEVVGVGPSGELLVKVRAVPADGAANDAVLRTIADALDVAPTRLHLVRGATSRTKVVGIDAVSPAALQAHWPGLAIAMR